ncbi:unnamed protein product [Rangifer tarandus platyrhynchus]|uniref:Uncharacterized protein n=2 Tax=Rangifer tarandus platyrhynchus TaxID=3082113 RepID=A0ACB0DZZ9_RANTA|nr:unnamed protein product [Rangifer tarandus platyrhynchus]CAI9693841.1 unnamed protein product [Rangifer tarandus platyrhynchus]
MGSCLSRLGQELRDPGRKPESLDQWRVKGSPDCSSGPVVSVQDQLSPWDARGGGLWAAGPGARAMARGGGGLAGVLRGSGGRREAGSADEPRTEPELERAAGGRAGARRSRAGARARGGGAAGTARRANARRGARAGDRLGRVRGVGAAFLARLGWARASGRGLQERGLRGGGCGGARAPGGAGTCGGGETEPRRVRGKAVLILTPNVFGESCRRGTLEGGGVEATDRLTAAAAWTAANRMQSRAMRESGPAAPPSGRSGRLSLPEAGKDAAGIHSLFGT